MKNIIKHDEKLKSRGFKRIGDYEGNRTHILHECQKGHRFLADSYHLSTLGKCPHCRKEEREKKNIPCKQCGKMSNHKFCSKECKSKFFTDKYRGKNSEKRLEGISQEEISQMVECKICGHKSNCLNTHIIKGHKMSTAEYKEIYGGELHSGKYKKEASERVSGDKNPIHKLENKQEISPFSKHFYLKRGFSEEEAIKMAIEKEQEARNNTKREDINCTMEYWLKKCDGNEKRAQAALRERQNTFTLKKCTEKYGEEEGKIRWQERQDKWIATLNLKSDEEKAEINKKKLLGALSTMKKSYSKISQELFVGIYENIRNKYSDIYFATKNQEGIVIDDGVNKEYMLNVGTKYRLIDFYIPSIKKMIEFDGTYWHGEARGNQERDRLREEEITNTIPELKILHISEKDYKNDPDKVLQDCLRFLDV